MANRYGNAKWRALSDEPGEPLPFDDELDDLFALLSPARQQAVARGDVSIPDLIEYLTSSRDMELCTCGKRNVSPKYVRFGLCAVCARLAMNEALESTLAEIAVQADAVRLRQQVARARDAAGIPRPRKSRAPRLDPDAASASLAIHYEADDRGPAEYCSTCGDAFHPHGDERECVSCQERRDRRESIRTSDR